MAEILPKLAQTGALKLGKYSFQRLALGAMRLLSSNAQVDGRSIECYADPKDPEANRSLIHAAIQECGIGYVDFARGYGARPGDGERWFMEWMAPFLDDVLWATKVGYTRDSEGGWVLNLCPKFLTDEIQLSLKELVSPIPLCYLTAGSTDDVTILNRQANTPESFKPLLDSHARGEISHLGVANVTATDLKQLLDMAPIAIVQNKFTVASLASPDQREVLEICRSQNIPFVAWGLFQSDDESPWVPGPDLLQAAQELSMSPQEASIAILLSASPNFVALTGVTRRQSLSSSVRAANQTVPTEILERFLTTSS